jgi:4-hydroxy-tetrahydrodipicolinate reductase
VTVPQSPLLIYGIGQYGGRVAGIAATKAWPIVAAVNRAGDKVGRDLGEVAGFGHPIGVVVEDCDLVDYRATGAEVAIVTMTDRLDVNFPAYERLLGAGINVICIGTQSSHPIAADPELGTRIDTLAKDNGVTFTGTSVWDMTRIWSGILVASPTTELRGLTLTSVTNVGYAERNEAVLFDVPVDCPSLGRTIEPGVSAGTRIVSKVATAEGVTADMHVELRLLLDGEREHTEWKVDGRPPCTIRIDRRDSVHHSAAALFNRIPDVVAAPPGIQLVSQLGVMTPSPLIGSETS